ncbi:MAG: Gfo/Idh/MocA family oxidoreductase [Clostridia bacterium]|nr:Gfo/Idh/MocA family oxidoreductase [Clostridia bacterium]
MERVIKIGIIGCGNIANAKHMPILFNISGVELVAFCDIVPEKARAAADKFGVPGAPVFENYKDLLAIDEIEVVHICTPNLTHRMITVDALEAGKHVMCEKPMAVTAVDAKAMLDAAKRTGKKLTIGYQNRFRPDSMFMKKEAEKGTFGEVYFAKATALRRRAVPTWGIFQDKDAKAGPLFDIGTHALDLTLWMMNNYKPKYCVGSIYNKLNGSPKGEQGNIWGSWDPEKYTAEDSAFGFVVMENGATIFLESSWALNLIDAREAITTICGTKAGADMVNGVRINGILNDEQYVLNSDFGTGGVAFIQGNQGPSPAECEAVRWIEAIRNDTEVFTKPEEAYCVTRILEGIYESGKSGRVYYFDNE